MNDIGATEVAKRLKCQGLTLTIIPPAMSGLSAKWRVEGHMEGMRSLLAECKQLKEEHCEDCCCAQSWAALGITKYTGKSIPEEIEALKERAQKAEARCADQKRILDNIQKSVESGPDMVELDRLRTEAARWQALRPEVQIFAEAMERKLRENDHKGGWDDMPSRWLRGRLAGEVRELEAAIAAYIDKIDICNREQDLSKSRQAILSECADIANFAMMIADNCKSLVAAAALGCSPLAWLMTPERIKALEQVLKYVHKDIEYEVSETDEEVLRSMLAEAKQ